MRKKVQLYWSDTQTFSCISFAIDSVKVGSHTQAHEEVERAYVYILYTISEHINSVKHMDINSVLYIKTHIIIYEVRTECSSRPES